MDECLRSLMRFILTVRVKVFRVIFLSKKGCGVNQNLFGIVIEYTFLSDR